jgi:tetratricopeptide (TPR) repeat protein
MRISDCGLKTLSRAVSRLQSAIRNPQSKIRNQNTLTPAGRGRMGQARATSVRPGASGVNLHRFAGDRRYNAPMDDQLARMARLPQRAGEEWVGGIVRMPAWIRERGDAKPWRPAGAVWASVASGRIHMSRPAPPAEVTAEVVLRTLAEFALDRKLAGYRPEVLQVAGAELARELIARLDGSGIRVVARDEIPALKALMEEMTRGMNPDQPPGPLDDPDVTVDRMRAFADAAADFYRAAPWDHLLDDDLIRVESTAAPGAVPRELGYVSVLGAAGKTFGLGFFDSERSHDQMRGAVPPDRGTERRPLWTLQFQPIDELPFADADLWEEAGLPLASPAAYPAAYRFDPKGPILRPDAAQLAYLEGLLRALASTTEAELDAGRWNKTVATADGPLDLNLSIPHLLASQQGATPLHSSARAPALGLMGAEQVLARLQRAAQEQGFESAEQANAWLDEHVNTTSGGAPGVRPDATPADRAQELMYSAFEARGRRQVQLAREALSLWPECADAYVLLAQHVAGNPERALPLYEQAVAAGRRAIGAEAFDELAGDFWGILETRPYMRALEGLARMLGRLGRHAEAADQYREMLRLNPGDNQGVRYPLGPLLIRLGLDDEADRLMNAGYADDDAAVFTYGRALLAFRRTGASRKARELLQAAMRANPFVTGLLLGMMEPPAVEPSTYSPGDPTEAFAFADDLLMMWHATPGAMEWLESCPPPTGRGPGSRSAAGKRKSTKARQPKSGGGPKKSRGKRPGGAA